MVVWMEARYLDQRLVQLVSGGRGIWSFFAVKLALFVRDEASLCINFRLFSRHTLRRSRYVYQGLVCTSDKGSGV